MIGLSKTALLKIVYKKEKRVIEKLKNFKDKIKGAYNIFGKYFLVILTA